jgi:hypothetical protein
MKAPEQCGQLIPGRHRFSDQLHRSSERVQSVAFKTLGQTAPDRLRIRSGHARIDQAFRRPSVDMSGFFRPARFHLQLADMLADPVPSTSRCAASRVCALPNTLGKTSSACFFYELISLTCTPHCQPSRPAVFCPLRNPRLELASVPLTLHVRPVCLCGSTLRGSLETGDRILTSYGSKTRTSPRTAPCLSVPAPTGRPSRGCLKRTDSSSTTGRSGAAPRPSVMETTLVDGSRQKD